jgi:hypothetical protein
MAEGEYWPETVRRRRKARVETLVAGVVGGLLAGTDGEVRPDKDVIKNAFAWADAIIKVSDRREKDGE